MNALMNLNDLSQRVARVRQLDYAPVVAQRRGIPAEQIHNHSLHDAVPSFTNFRYSAICG